MSLNLGGFIPIMAALLCGSLLRLKQGRHLSSPCMFGRYRLTAGEDTAEGCGPGPLHITAGDDQAAYSDIKGE